MHFFRDKKMPLDFMCIGAVANYQASKAIVQFRQLIFDGDMGFDIDVVPLRYLTITEDETGKKEEKDCFVWRVTYIQCNDLSKGLYEFARCRHVATTDVQ